MIFDNYGLHCHYRQWHFQLANQNMIFPNTIFILVPSLQNPAKGSGSTFCLYHSQIHLLYALQVKILDFKIQLCALTLRLISSCTGISWIIYLLKQILQRIVCARVLILLLPTIESTTSASKILIGITLLFIMDIVFFLVLFWLLVKYASMIWLGWL